MVAIERGAMVSLRILNWASVYQLATTALVGLVTMWQWPAGLSGVLLGGLVMAVNLFIMRTVVNKMVDSPKPRTLYGFALAIKFAVLLGLVAGIMKFFEPDLLAFMAGLSSFFVGMAGAMLQQAFGTDDAPMVNRSV